MPRVEPTSSHPVDAWILREGIPVGCRLLDYSGGGVGLWFRDPSFVVSHGDFVQVRLWDVRPNEVVAVTGLVRSWRVEDGGVRLGIAVQAVPAG